MTVNLRRPLQRMQGRCKIHDSWHDKWMVPRTKIAQPCLGHTESAARRARACYLVATCSDPNPIASCVASDPRRSLAGRRMGTYIKIMLTTPLASCMRTSIRLLYARGYAVCACRAVRDFCSSHPEEWHSGVRNPKRELFVVSAHKHGAGVSPCANVCTINALNGSAEASDVHDECTCLSDNNMTSAANVSETTRT